MRLVVTSGLSAHSMKGSLLTEVGRDTGDIVGEWRFRQNRSRDRRTAEERDWPRSRVGRADRAISNSAC